MEEGGCSDLFQTLAILAQISLSSVLNQYSFVLMLLEMGKWNMMTIRNFQKKENK
jgi:hypothetical protein